MNLERTQDKDGRSASPTLPEWVKNYLIDIDGTITEDVPNEEPERMSTCQPYNGARDVLNKWYNEGHIITLFTSRKEENRIVTEAWLEKHGFKYHGLLMNKPRGGNYAIIDNHMFKVCHYDGDWSKVKKEMDNYVHDYSSVPN